MGSMSASIMQPHHAHHCHHRRHCCHPEYSQTPAPMGPHTGTTGPTPPATHRGRPIPPSHSSIILSRTSPERAGNNPARLKSCLFAPYTTDNDSSPVRAPVRPGVSLVCRGISRKCTNSRAAFPKFTTSPQLPQGLIFLSLLPC